MEKSSEVVTVDKEVIKKEVPDRPLVEVPQCVCRKSQTDISQNIEQKESATIACESCGEIFHLNCVSSAINNVTLPKYTCNECREELDLGN